MMNFASIINLFYKNFDMIKTGSMILILNINSKVLSMYYYLLSNSILNMNLIIEDRNQEHMKSIPIYAFWHELTPYFISGYPSFFEIIRTYGFLDKIENNDILIEIKHTTSSHTFVTLVSPAWLREQLTYGQIVQSLNEVVKNKSNSNIHDVVCVSIDKKCEMTEFYKDFKHSLNIVKLTSEQFCKYFLLKNPKYKSIIKSDDTLTFIDNNFQERQLKKIQYIN